MFCILRETDTCKASLPLYLCACVCGIVLQIFDVVMHRSFIRIRIVVC